MKSEDAVSQKSEDDSERWRDASLWDVWSSGPLHRYFVGKWAASTSPTALIKIPEVGQAAEADEAAMKALGCSAFLSSSEASELREREAHASRLAEPSFFENSTAIAKVTQANPKTTQPNPNPNPEPNPTPTRNPPQSNHNPAQSQLQPQPYPQLLPNLNLNQSLALSQLNPNPTQEPTQPKTPTLTRPQPQPQPSPNATARPMCPCSQLSCICSRTCSGTRAPTVLSSILLTLRQTSRWRSRSRLCTRSLARYRITTHRWITQQPRCSSS